MVTCCVLPVRWLPDVWQCGFCSLFSSFSGWRMLLSTTLPVRWLPDVWQCGFVLCSVHSQADACFFLPLYQLDDYQMFDSVVLFSVQFILRLTYAVVYHRTICLLTRCLTVRFCSLFSLFPAWYMPCSTCFGNTRCLTVMMFLVCCGKVSESRRFGVYP